MVGEGIIPAPVGHGRYLLAQCVKRYCEYSRADSKSKGNKRVRGCPGGVDGKQSRSGGGWKSKRPAINILRLKP